MSRTSVGTQPLYSTLAEDADLREIVELFVEEMPDRVANLLDRFAVRDWTGLRRVAHQLKGAAGSYGFAPITPTAGRLEDAIRNSRPEDEIRRAVDSLVELCRQARAGVLE